MSSSRHLTIIICTYNRAEDALGCVAQLDGRVGRDEVDVLVVNNASDVANTERLRSALRDTDVTYLEEHVPGLSVARNRGRSVAKTEWIAYLDDDSVPRADWIERALALVRGAHADLGLIGGVAIPSWPARRLPGSVSPERLGIRWRDLISLLEVERPGPIADCPMLVGCNMLVRAASLDRAGGFPVGLGRTPERLLGGEEIALGVALTRLGETVSFAPDLVVQHKIPAERLTLRWMRARARAEGELLWRVRRSSLVLGKVVVSSPIVAAMAVADSLTTQSMDHYVRLWHNLGYCQAALRFSRADANYKSYRPAG